MTWGQTSAGCPRIFTNHTNLIRIREIRVNSWTVTSVWAHLALGHLEGRGWGGALSCLDGRRDEFRVARRARSWPAARGVDGFRGRGRRSPYGRGRGGDRPWRVVHKSSRICTNSVCIREIRVNSWTVNWRFAQTRNGASRRSRKPACTGHESARAGRRGTKTLRPSLEFSTFRGERRHGHGFHGFARILREWEAKKNSALNSQFVGDKLEVRAGGGAWMLTLPLSTSTLFLQLDFPSRPARGRGAQLRGMRRIVYNIAQLSPDGGCAVGRRGRDGAAEGRFGNRACMAL